eukprot:12418894-Karenia_brevis.AAC.1
MAGQWDRDDLGQLLDDFRIWEEGGMPSEGGGRGGGGKGGGGRGGGGDNGGGDKGGGDKGGGKG